ncbi:hypothetical protein ACQCN2_21690 [Brevibacillus ginsengisoli]|uniref:hypothetical protein n=1 Tax=Brevibacillus ginsengisoli TaxID=363854 RepID=UPI003CF47CF2
MYLMKRLLRTKNLEFFNVQKSYIGDKICSILLVDIRRPSSINDFPHLLDQYEPGEDDHIFNRKNVIKVIVFSPSELDSEVWENIGLMIDCLIDVKESCAADVKFEKVDMSLASAFPDITLLAPYIEKYGEGIELPKIPKENFNYLSQD